MPITPEEASKIREHLLKQLDNFPEDKRHQIEEQINSMTDEQIEAFVKQNNLTHLGGQCILCSIVANQTPSHKIEEDKNNLAILEINPETKGHILVIPKEHLDEVPESTRVFAQEVANKIKFKLNPREIEINELKIMGHALLEVVPLYGEKKERRQASEEELLEIKRELKKVKEIEMPAVPPKKMSEEKIPVLLPRIP